MPLPLLEPRVASIHGRDPFFQGSHFGLANFVALASFARYRNLTKGADYVITIRISRDTCLDGLGRSTSRRQKPSTRRSGCRYHGLFPGAHRRGGRLELDVTTL